MYKGRELEPNILSLSDKIKPAKKVKILFIEINNFMKKPAEALHNWVRSVQTEGCFYVGQKQNTDFLVSFEE
jgi:hypothetical protein